MSRGSAGIPVGQVLVTNRLRIAKRYLRGFFVIDAARLHGIVSTKSKLMRCSAEGI